MYRRFQNRRTVRAEFAALEGTENAINVHISNLRKKIAAIDNSKSYIKTVWGIGFKMDI